MTGEPIQPLYVIGQSRLKGRGFLVRFQVLVARRPEFESIAVDISIKHKSVD